MSSDWRKLKNEYGSNSFLIVEKKVVIRFHPLLWHYGSEWKKKHRKIAIQSFAVSRAREWANWVSAVEGASKASVLEQGDEWAVWVNERTDERVIQYFSLDSWLFWPTVYWEIRCSRITAYSPFFFSLFQSQQRFWKSSAVLLTRGVLLLVWLVRFFSIFFPWWYR